MSDGSVERTELQRRDSRAFRLGLALVAFFVLMAVVALLAVALGSDPEPGKGCTTDARMGPNGEIYGRDPDRNCHFVDEQGNDLGG